MIENRIYNTAGTRIHTTYGTPPPKGYRFTLEPNGHEYVVVEVVPDGARAFLVWVH